MATLAWRAFFKRWNFFWGTPSVDNKFYSSFRAFLVSKFAATIFTTKPDDEERKRWWRVYLGKGAVAHERAQAMEKALQENRILFTRYKRQLTKIIEKLAVPGYIRPCQSPLKAIYPRKLIRRIFLDRAVVSIMSLPADADEKAKLKNALQREQTLDAVSHYLFQRALKEIRKQPITSYIDPLTDYAGYERFMHLAARELLPMPTFSNVIGFKLLYPPFLLDAIGSGLGLLVARFFCWAINGIFCGWKNSIPAVILKGLFAGPFLMCDGVLFVLAKLATGSGWAEMIKECCGKKTTTIAPMPVFVRAKKDYAIEFDRSDSYSKIRRHSSLLTSSSELEKYKVPEERKKPVDAAEDIHEEVKASIIVVKEQTRKRLRLKRSKSCVQSRIFERPLIMTKIDHALDDVEIYRAQNEINKRSLMISAGLLKGNLLQQQEEKKDVAEDLSTPTVQLRSVFMA